MSISVDTQVLETGVEVDHVLGGGAFDLVQAGELLLAHEQHRLLGLFDAARDREHELGASGVEVLVRRTHDPGVDALLHQEVAHLRESLGAPFGDHDEIRLVVQRALERTRLERENRLLLEQVQRQYGFENLIGSGPAMRRVFETLQKVAETDLTVLVRGESGTGKELVAQALHNRTVETLDDPRFGPTRYLRHPVRYEKTPASLRRHAPRLGEHTDEILFEAGYSGEEVAALRESGAAR